MSRLLWAGLGAAGGIYLYRKGQHAWEDAKESGVAGNASKLASTTSTLLNHARRSLAEAQAEKDAELSDEHVIQLPVKGHQPGMMYEVRVVEASVAQEQVRRSGRATEGRSSRFTFQRQRASA